MRIREERKCFNCDQTFNELFRCRFDERGDWIMVCSLCLDESKTNSLFYQYGGTWKAKKV